MKLVPTVLLIGRFIIWGFVGKTCLVICLVTPVLTRVVIVIVCFSATLGTTNKEGDWREICPFQLSPSEVRGEVS